MSPVEDDGSDEVAPSSSTADSSFAAALSEAAIVDAAPLATEQPREASLRAAASANNSLWFYSLDLDPPSDRRCGQINAAPFVPAELFGPSLAHNTM